jgi:DNA-nicking Smr family endonuclease
MARRRTLRPEEEEIWSAVTRTARAMHSNARSVLQRKDDARETKSFPASDPAVPVFKPFRLGEKTKPAATHKLAPTLSESLASAPVQMDAKAYGRMTRGKLLPEARIDLHGLTLAQAHPELIQFIVAKHAMGMRLVLVITGKGKAKPDHGPIPSRVGALRHQVPQWLRLPPLGPLVLQVTEAHLRHGGSGAYYVYLRRGR